MKNNVTPIESKPSSFDYESLLDIGANGIFGVKSSKLPLPPMLMFNRITNVNDSGGKYEKGIVEAELDITPDMWFFDCHFRDDAVMPGCLGLDALWQLTGFFLGWSEHFGFGRALGVKEVRFTGQVLPTNKLVRYRIDVKRVIKRRLVMGLADGQMEVDGKLIYTAEDMRVGIFEKTDFS